MGKRPLLLLTRNWFRLAVASATVAGVITVPTAALAIPHPGDAEFSYTLNAETKQIGFWFGSEDADVTCAWTGSSGVEPTTETTEVPETQCFIVDVAGPNGQVNHGTIVSAFVHTLKDVMAVSGFDGPPGQFISEVAAGDDGKSDDEGQGPPAFVEEKKDSSGSKSKGSGKGSGKGKGGGNGKGKGIGRNG